MCPWETSAQQQDPDLLHNVGWGWGWGESGDGGGGDGVGVVQWGGVSG